jgi:hypothetical protein
MKPKEVIQKRLGEIEVELERLIKDPYLRDGTKQADRVNRLVDEGMDLRDQLKTHQKATSMMSMASPEEHQGALNRVSMKGFGIDSEQRIAPRSMFELDRTQLDALKQAARQKTPIRVHVGEKGIEHGSTALRDKSPLSRAALSTDLPPVQLAGDRGFWGIPLEITRVSNYLPQVALENAGIAYWTHDSNGASPAYTLENTTKPDVSPQVSEHYVKASKVAGRFLASHELIVDAGDEFAGMLLNDLSRAIYVAESDLILNGTTASNGFNGFNNTSGTLTYAAAAGETPLDTIQSAMVAMRNDYFIPDTLILNPSTMGALRKVKDSQGRYLLGLLSSAKEIDQTSETESFWGLNVIQTTKEPAGQAVLLSVQSGAGVIYLREPLSTFFDPYSLASQNTYQYIAEMRFALTVPRPQAVSLITGLPTS